MSITEYDANIKPHLNAARELAYRTTREISRLPARPAFFTLAEHELEEARKALEGALTTIKCAQALYEAKPIDQ
jgi:predicted translin family RNA/ssDNA-binding protein